MKKLMFIAVLGLLVTSCKKNNVGPAGKDGKDGADGQVNTISYVFNDVEISTPAGIYFADTLSTPALTQTVLDKGAVVVTVQQSTSTSSPNYVDTSGWYSMPYAVNGVQASYYTVKYKLMVGKVVVYTGADVTGNKLNFKVTVID